MPLRVAASRTVHDACGTALAQLVDGADGVDGRVQRTSRVEVLSHHRKQVLARTPRCRSPRLVGRRRNPRVRQRLVRRDALALVDGQAAPNEVARRLRYATPVLLGREVIVGRQNGLHLLVVGVAIEGRVAAEQEVGDDANCPDVAIERARYSAFCPEGDEPAKEESLHWLSVPNLSKYLGCHVAWRTACCCEDVKSFLVHDPAEAKVGYQQVCIVLGRPKEQVLWLQIAVHDAMVVQAGDGRKRCAH